MRKQHSPEFKAQIVLEILKEEKSISELASEYDIHPNLGYWIGICFFQISIAQS